MKENSAIFLMTKEEQVDIVVLDVLTKEDLKRDLEEKKN